MPKLPITHDVAALVGDFGEGVQNRSLLLDKFVFHKKWGLDAGFNANDAHRWSLMRVSDGGANELLREARRRRENSGGSKVNIDKVARLQAEAELAQRLASTQVEAPDACELRRRHSRRFLALFRSAFGTRASVTIGKLEGRLAINLSDGLLQNAGISLDRLFGLPFAPGSAVKGVCRHVALEKLHLAKGPERAKVFEAFRQIFGTADNDFANGDLKPYGTLLGGLSKNQKGAVIFLPAHPLGDAKVIVDLTNVHYPDYYRSRRSEDLSKERPLPNPFPVVEAGAQFAFLLLLKGSEDAALLRQAEAWLREALTVRGLGAKTSSGYGWFSIDESALEAILEEEAREAKEQAEASARLAEVEAKAADEKKRLAALPAAERACEQFKKLPPEDFAQNASGIEGLGAEEQKGLLLALLTAGKKETWKAWKKSGKPANKARVESILGASRRHGIKLP
jgi:CRISPR type III-B/RAMP module RAMP protein Cmr6